MRINEESWHAVMYERIFGKLPKSLCPYFWGLIVAFIVHLVMIAGLLMAVGAFIWVAWSMIYVLVSSSCSEDIWIGAITGYIALFIGGMSKLISYIEDKKPRESLPKKYVVNEFIKAKFSKVCPKIDWYRK